MFIFDSPLSLARMPRQMIAIHTNMPTISRICHSRGRSRYSHCWENSPPWGITP